MTTDLMNFIQDELADRWMTAHELADTLTVAGWEMTPNDVERIVGDWVSQGIARQGNRRTTIAVFVDGELVDEEDVESEVAYTVTS